MKYKLLSLICLFLITCLFANSLVESKRYSYAFKNEIYKSDDNENDKEPQPIVSLNQNLTRDQLDQLPEGIFISQFISYILTGSYDGQVEYNNATDELSVDNLIDFGLLILNNVLKDEIMYDPEKYFGILYKKKYKLLI